MKIIKFPPNDTTSLNADVEVEPGVFKRVADLDGYECEAAEELQLRKRDKHLVELAQCDLIIAELRKRPDCKTYGDLVAAGYRGPQKAEVLLQIRNRGYKLQSSYYQELAAKPI